MTDGLFNMASGALTGVQLTRCERRNDYIELYFKSGAVVTVYSNVFVNGEHFEMRQRVPDLDPPVGAPVLSLTCDEAAICLDFGASNIINISLRDEDWNGPEAAVSWFGDNRTFVVSSNGHGI